MDVYNFWCTNSECPEHSGYTKIKLTVEESKVEQNCLECGHSLKLMGIVTNFHAKIGSMTPNERKQELLKRSRKHSQNDSYLSQRKKELIEKTQ